jgi:uncharacterized protein (DUF885 family)
MFETKLDRRTLLGGLGTGGAMALLPAMARAQAGDPLRAMLAAVADEILALSPEGATQLGLDNGRNAALRGQSSDAGQHGIDQFNALNARLQARLAAFPAATLSPEQRLRFDTVAYGLQRGTEGARFRFGGGARDGFGGGATPYVISQQNGTVSGLPDLLISAQPLKTKADAEAYLARVAAFGKQLDQETELMRAQAAIGVVPPKFVAENALGILKAFRATPATKQSLVTHLAEKTSAFGGDYGAKAAKLIETSVYPALDRQIAAFAATTANAPMTPSVTRLPDGEAYYAWALRLGTTTIQSPDEVHRIGLAQNSEIKARMDVILKAQGMTRGTVGARVQALNRDPKMLFPNTDAGRAQLIAYLNGRLAAIRPMMPRISHLKLKADVLVKRVPPAIQDGAALGYMQPAPLDGSRPAQYYVNLKTTSLWPRYQLASLTAHEGIPGHSWQTAYVAEHQAELPAVTAMMNFNAYTEGWALYAEQLVDEEGLYDHDPWGRIGYLQGQQFRACRLVADTGLHAKGWTREQSVDFLAGESGKGKDAVTSETDRYCAAPGQACGYKTGHNEIVRLREKAKAALGPKFDLPSYNDAVVKACSVPLELLGGVIDRFIAAGGKA